jgi:hypothetical protein
VQIVLFSRGCGTYQIITVNNTLDKAEVSWHEVEFVGDEYFSHIEAQAWSYFVRASLLKSKRHLVGQIEDGFEVDVTPDNKRK